MGEPVEQRRGHLRVAKDTRPLPERQVRRHDQRDALVEFADQVEQQRATVLGERQVTELVEHDRILIEQARREAPGAPLTLLGIELVDEIDHAVEASALALHDRSARECRGEMRFAGARAADEDDVAGAGQVIPGVELADLALAHERLAEVEAVEVTGDGEAREA